MKNEKTTLVSILFQKYGKFKKVFCKAISSSICLLFLKSDTTTHFFHLDTGTSCHSWLVFCSFYPRKLMTKGQSKSWLSHITYRYIDPPCHNFENCLLPRFSHQSGLSSFEGKIMEGDNFQNKCSKIQCIYIYIYICT